MKADPKNRRKAGIRLEESSMKKRTAVILAVLLAAALIFAIAGYIAAEAPDNAEPDTHPTFVRMEDAAAADGSSFTEKKEQAGTIIAYDPETLPDPSSPSSYPEAWFEAVRIGSFISADGTVVRIALSEEYGLFAYTWGSPCKVVRWYIREPGWTFLP